MKYSAPLDGIRAVAILGVLWFHAVPGTLLGGFAGVDVFYVLSGFLITSNLQHDLREGRFSLREFYVRRVMRLLPNAVLTVLVTVLLARLLLLPSTAAQAGRHGTWALLNVSNVYVLRDLGGYWGLAATSSPLLHTWSLAVEEQFYLVLPAFLALVARGPRWRLLVPAVPVASFLLAVVAARTHPAGAFYLLPTRAWQPMVGAALAWWLVPAAADRPLRTVRATRAVSVLSAAGLAAIVLSFVVITTGDGFPGLPALPAALGALAVLVAVAAGDAWTTRLLSWGPFVAIGKVSYSLYLWHWPLITLGRARAELLGLSPEAGALVGAAASVVVAVAVFAGVERPFRARGPGRGRRGLVLGAAFAATLLACVVVGRTPPGGEARALFEPTTFSGFRYSVLDARDDPTKAGAPRLATVECAPADPHADRVWRTGGIVHAHGGAVPRVVLVGSSHALMYAATLDDVCRRRGVSVAFLCADGVSIFPDGHDASRADGGETLHAARAQWIRTWKPDLVVGTDRYDLYGGDEARFEARVRALVAELSSAGSRVVLLAQVPALPMGETFDLREYVAFRHGRDGALPALEPDGREAWRARATAVLERVAGDTPSLTVLRPDLAMRTPQGTVRYADGRRFLYTDDDHLSDAGAETARAMLDEVVARATAR